MPTGETRSEKSTSRRLWIGGRAVPISGRLVGEGEMPLVPRVASLREAEWFDASAGSEAAHARHIDAASIAAITGLYREILPPGGAILDLLSGWVSHLPPEIPYSRVVGVGTNACELAENPFLDEWRVQDLNSNPYLAFASAEFDGAAICVSIQHLTRPCEVIREVGRVLKPGAPLLVTFSNCCLPTRAIA